MSSSWRSPRSASRSCGTSWSRSALPDPAPGSDRSPIAVVGLACRFPGAPDVGAFWRLLEAGSSAVTEGVPGSGVG
ncbi:MAG: hypothetical protein F4Z54_02150, partial [Acidimicrobiaceae bacterium]|nr:hypothetical protein [Acidimicrobiaceae bacterium]MYI15943.1 hypothetical protein [Acidimicrobiaceae bacterium]